MKLFFTALVREVPEEHVQLCHEIVQILTDMGHQVISEHVVGSMAEMYGRNDLKDEEIITISKRMLAGKNQADMLIVEASYPCVSLGQEITYALRLNKPVVVLYQKGVTKPRVLRALNTDSLYVVEYDRQDLKQVLSEYIEYAKDIADTRFNFFVSPQIVQYLDWVAGRLRVPRAVYLRDLIDKALEQDKEYIESNS